MFMAALEGVTPLGSRDRIAVPPPPPSAVKIIRFAEPPPSVKLAVEGDGQRYAARGPGVSHAQLAELRAGKVRAELTIDLHGDTVARALERLRDALAQGVNLYRCVCIVHGKGTHSEYGAPLREAVLAELLGPLSGYVQALSTASAADGGEGATLVLLRRTR